MYSTYNEGKFAVAERFIRFRFIHFDVLDDIVDKCNNTVDKTIKIKPIGVTGDSYAEYNEDVNKKDPKFKVGGHIRI